MKFEKTSTNYRLDLSESQWDKLESIRDAWMDEYEGYIDIFKTTEKIGVYDLNWSGHFGMCLFFRIEHENEKKR